MFKKIKKWQIHQCGTTKLVVFILFFKTQVFFFCVYVCIGTWGGHEIRRDHEERKKKCERNRDSNGAH